MTPPDFELTPSQRARVDVGRALRAARAALENAENAWRNVHDPRKDSASLHARDWLVDTAEQVERARRALRIASAHDGREL